MSIASATILVVLVISLCSCAGLTPTQRVDQNPTLFHTKSYQDKQLILNGFLRPGMTKDAVFLAWGNPKNQSKGYENGATFEEWTYQKLKPKLNMELGIGGGGLAGPGFGLDRSVDRIVRFENGKVAGFRTNN